LTRLDLNCLEGLLHKRYPNNKDSSFNQPHQFQYSKWFSDLATTEPLRRSSVVAAVSQSRLWRASNVPTRTQANSLPPPQSLRLLPQPRHPALGSSPHHNPPTSTFTPTVEGTRASSYFVAHPWQTSLEPCWARINFHANISIMSMNDKQSL
jgi:hypothetical protein